MFIPWRNVALQSSYSTSWRRRSVVRPEWFPQACPTGSPVKVPQIEGSRKVRVIIFFNFRLNLDVKFLFSPISNFKCSVGFRFKNYLLKLPFKVIFPSYLLKLPKSPFQDTFLNHLFSLPFWSYFLTFQSYLFTLPFKVTFLSYLLNLPSLPFPVSFLTCLLISHF